MENSSTQMTPQEELELLRSENLQKEQASKELDRLWEMFPEITLDDLPDELWVLVENGESLLGAYCILLAKAGIESKKAQDKNRENSLRTPPAVKGGTEKKEYFTRAQVAGMSRAQVRKNYDSIVDSMKYWN